MNNKIMKAMLRPFFLLLILLLIIRPVYAQPLPVSVYGLSYINQKSLFQASLIDHPEKQMISLLNIDGLILDLRYASENNFMHKKLYAGKVFTTYLRKPAYNALEHVARELSARGLILVIFDAYRPYSVTESIWEKVKDDRYAANPANGSGHNRGIAVDLSFADAKSHRYADMPTPFDSFSDSAHQNFPDLPQVQKVNREFLKNTMEKFGFIPLATEWWHFSWPDPEQFEVLDLSFEELRQP